MSTNFPLEKWEEGWTEKWRSPRSYSIEVATCRQTDPHCGGILGRAPEGAQHWHAGGGGDLGGGVSGRRGQGRDLRGRFSEPRWVLPPPG